MIVDRGAIVLVEVAEAARQDHHRVRPCVAVSDPAVNADQGFPLIAVVPVTATPGKGALYPQLSAGKSGLTKPSYALIDQLRSIDKRRIRRVFGRITQAELAALDQGLELFFGLTSPP